MKIITITNNKGGVGKTATTKNLAKALSLNNYKVAVVDMDDQSNLTDSIDDNSGFDLLVTDKSLEQLKTLCNQNYDFILIDNPPDLGEEAIHSYLVSDYLIIPVNLTGNAIKGMQKSTEAMETIKSHNPKLELLGVLVTCFDRRDRESDQLLQALQSSLGNKLFKSIIRISQSIKKSDDEQILVQDYEQKKWFGEKKATLDFANLAKEIIQKIQ